MKEYKVGMLGGSFNPVHNGHVKSIIKASELCDELHIIIGDLPNRDVFNINEKLNWFNTIFKDYDNIYLHVLTDKSKEKKEYTLDKWLADAEIIKHMINKPIDIVFCGTDYNRDDSPYYKCYPNSFIYFFDRDDNISSTRFKSDIEKYKNDVPNIVYESYRKKGL